MHTCPDCGEQWECEGVDCCGGTLVCDDCADEEGDEDEDDGDDSED